MKSRYYKYRIVQTTYYDNSTGFSVERKNVIPWWLFFSPVTWLVSLSRIWRVVDKTVSTIDEAKEHVKLYLAQDAEKAKDEDAEQKRKIVKTKIIRKL